MFSGKENMNIKKYIIIMFFALCVFGCASGHSGFGTGLTVVPGDETNPGGETGVTDEDTGSMDKAEGSASDRDNTASGEINKEAGHRTSGELDSGIELSGTSGYGSDTSEDINKASNDVTVYVCGEVCDYGVYVLPQGSRICDVVEAAGGFTADACKTCINLADLLYDGEMIVIPSVEEASSFSIGISPSGGEGFGEGNTQEDNIGANGLVNINTADAETLKTLPGIGDSKANAIISYRQEHGFFTSIEDIMKINGIKEGVFNNIKDFITV